MDYTNEEVATTIELLLGRKENEEQDEEKKQITLALRKELEQVLEKGKKDPHLITFNLGQVLLRFVRSQGVDM